MRRVVRKFKNALDGVIIAYKLDNSVKLQFILAFITIIVSLFLNLNRSEWLIIFLCIGGVIITEIFNTAIEELVNSLSHLMLDSQRKRIKDVSAGAVFVMAFISFVIMITILLSKGVFG